MLIKKITHYAVLSGKYSKDAPAIQDRWIDRSMKGRREEKMESKDFVKGVCILSSPICVDRVFNQLYPFLFVLALVID